MINLKSEPETEEMPGEVELDEPVYPEGLQVELESESLDKLGMATPSVGQRVRFEAEAIVQCVKVHETFGGQERCVTLQITDMNIGGASVRSLLS
jgi:hypothetical protein